MPLQIVVGTQWGDEGKGRIVDWLAAQAQVVARFNGGDNAGHTVTVGERIFKLHLLPSGIIHPHTTAVIGNGLVINPKILLEECELLRQARVKVNPDRLRISHAAHLLTPAHQAIDRAQEAARGKASIGTTGRGIGPAYTDKVSRQGIRLGAMCDSGFEDRLAEHLQTSNRILKLLGAPALEPGPLLDVYRGYAEQLAPYITDTTSELSRAIEDGKTILAEGAQGTLLDLDHGTYPFVTSSTTTAPGALSGLGLGLDAAQGARVIGVTKAFQTRVGYGPFPTELEGELAERLRGTGANPWDEYGTTTGRPRRVGWLDGVLLHYAAHVNGLTELALTKLDILSGIHPLQICVAYRDKTNPGFEPACSEPIYEELPGWDDILEAVRRWQDLPHNARRYLERIAELAEVPIHMVSVGPERGQMLTL